MRAGLACAFLLHGAAALAQFPLVRAFELRPNQLRPRIRAIAQDDRGLIWSAADIGLLRTDGQATELIARAAGITAITAAGSTAFMATSAGAVLRCDGRRCDTLLADADLAGSRIKHLLADGEGALWIGTRDTGLLRLAGDALQRWTLADGLPDDHINGLARLPGGRLAVATDQGIVVMQVGAVRARMSEAEGAPDNLVLSIASDGKGGIWAGTDRGGVFHWEPGAEPRRIVEPWPFGAVEGICEAGGMLWAVTRSAGLIAIDLELRRGIYRSAPLDAPPVHLLAADDEAVWWCDGGEVLHRADPAILVAGEHEGLGLRDITALCIDQADRLWFAKGHRLFRHDARFSEESRITELKVNGDPMTPIVSLAAAADGTIWAATFGSGLIAVGAGDAISRYSMRDGLSSDNALRARATAGGMVFATLEGITIKDGAGFTREGADAGFVFDALEAEGRIYMASDGKGIRIAERGRPSTVMGASRTYYALCRASDGRVWAAGPRTGFCALSAAGATCHAADAPPFDGDLYAIGEAGGRLIAFGSTGTLAFDPITLATTDVSVAFGLEGATAELGTMAGDAGGALWLASSAGLLRLEPKARHFARQVPAFFTSAALDGQPVPFDAPIVAPHDRSALVVGFTAAHWTDPGALRFQYRLLGYSERITETRDRVAAFPELPPGRYTFQARAFIGTPLPDAPWAELSVTIQPPWWGRKDLQALAALLTIAAGYLLIRARDRRMLERQRMEEEKVRFQLEALRSQVDPHFLFNSFNALAELIESEPAKAVEHVEELSTFFRNILLVRDRERIPVEEELRLLRNYFELEQRRFGERIKLRVDVDAAAARRAIVPLTLQLLVENALKHNVIAGPDPFVITIGAEGDDLVVRNPLRPRATPPRSTGFGLDSIRKRYAALSGRPMQAGSENGLFQVRVPLLHLAP